MLDISCIIIDDEFSARNSLENLLLTHFPNVSILDKKESLLEGVKSIEKLKPQIVFLDVEMPNYSGYEIINFFDKIDFQIIFVTAYDNYAINAFEIHAIDYILKPIEPNKLINAIKKAEKKIVDNQLIIDYQNIITNLNSNVPKTLLITENNKKQYIQIDDIIAIEAQRSYSYVYLNNGNKFLFSKNIGYFEEMLKEEDSFFRSHKSWLINTSYVINYSKTNLSINLNQQISAKLSRYKIKKIDSILLSSL